MKQKKLILCDPEADYAQQMAAFLQRDKDFPWEVRVYSALQDAEEILGKGSEGVLLLAESLAGEELPGLFAGRLVLLNESGEIRFPEIKHINKYQEAENVRKELIRLFAQQETTVYPTLQTEKAVKIIGLYSPVRRCLQTSFGITYSQLLAENCKVLYLNFGYYAEMPQLEAEDTEMDLGALMYYLGADRNKFFLHMRSMLRSIGNWDFISTIRNGTDLPGIAGEDWLKLIRRCGQLGEYDCIVLDLNESIQGLFEVLRQCEFIFTIGKEDGTSRYKLGKYEYLLERNGYQDVKEKTRHLVLPAFERLPESLEEYTRGALAEYVREMIAEEGEQAWIMRSGSRTCRTGS